MGTTPAPRSMTAVVVAPDGENRVLLRGLLRLQQVRVVGESDDPREAAELVATHRPGFLLADTTARSTSVGELIRRCRASAPGLRVILLTGSARSGVASAEAREADAVLPQPFRVQAFADTIRRLAG